MAGARVEVGVGVGGISVAVPVGDISGVYVELGRKSGVGESITGVGEGPAGVGMPGRGFTVVPQAASRRVIQAAKAR